MIRRNQHRAFTMIELLLVMVILAVLAGIAVPIYINRAAEAKVNATKVSLSNIKTALQAFEVDCDRFPTTEEGLEALVTRPANLTSVNWHQNMEKIPLDGWGRTFEYKYPGTADPNGYDLYSFGADGQDGTADDISVKDN